MGLASTITALRNDALIWMWQRLVVQVVENSNEIQPHRLPSDTDVVLPIPAGRRYAGLGEDVPLFFSRETPVSEQHSLGAEAAIMLTLWLKEWDGLGYALTEPYRGVGAPYPKLFERVAPAPTIPADFLVDDRLAGIATRGPFSVQTQRRSETDYVLDLSVLEGFDPREPFVATGGVVHFRREDNRLHTTGIEFRGRKVEPGAPGWALAEKRFLTGMNSYTTFVEHLLYLHIITAGVFGLASRMAFSHRHPLRILLQPFTDETSRVNNYNIDGLLLSEHSNVPLYSGYSLEQVFALLRTGTERYDFRAMDPERRAEHHGQLGDPMFPTVESAVVVYGHFRELAQRWCEHYLGQTVDEETRAFCLELDHRIPGGVTGLLGLEPGELGDPNKLRVEHVAHLIAVGAFASSVGHHIVNDLTRDYFMAFHIMPPAVGADGNPTLGVVLEKQSSIVTAGIMRYPLLGRAAIPDPPGRRLWSEFQDRLTTYEATLPSVDVADYLIRPSRVSSSIHA